MRTTYRWGALLGPLCAGVVLAGCSAPERSAPSEASATLTIEELNALSCGVPAGSISVRLADCAVLPAGAAAAGPVTFHAIPPTASENGGALRELVIVTRPAPRADPIEVAAIREVLADRPRDLSVELPAGEYEIQCRAAEPAPAASRVYVTSGTAPLSVTDGIQR